MSWLRIDDGFADHPKLLQLTVKDRWIWLQILCYCARYNTDGWLTDGISEAVRGATSVYLSRVFASGLLEKTDGNWRVHDWVIYNGATTGEKVNYYLDRHPEATANQVFKAIGGKRDLVLAEVKKYQETGTQGTTFTGTENGSPTSTRARASRPVPTPSTGTSTESETQKGAYFIARPPQKFSNEENDQ